MQGGASNEAPTPEEWAAELERAPTFGVALGRRLQELREAQELTAEQVAQTAQRLGLSWHRPTVGQIEKGKRGISGVELLLLPVIYGQPLRELLPEGAVWLTDEAAARRSSILANLNDPIQGANMAPGQWHLKGFDMDETMRQVERLVVQTMARWPAGAKRNPTPDEAEGKAAKRLDTTPEYVAYAARELWGRSLTEERDARLSDRATAPETPRALQSARGHITRGLLTELEPVIHQYEQHRIDPDGPFRWVPPGETEGEGPEHG
ncbi:helix-turn-helix transcriptional regulator [Streptomyces sp. NPDC020731]|uniref:helix-turn-helix transcriptional regulator n=1 Tax=Streptomyces sp. NPDC020731 TaxID=3365085 RepID=UPI00378F0CE1